MMAVRSCRVEDCGQVTALWARCGLTRSWNDPEADFRLALASPSSAVLGGFLADEIVAILRYPCPHVGEAYDFEVREPGQRR